ncbi:MAG: hypothetical protein EXS08_17130, partial [Planctomycetes bacterium]|nr:hypothetical protein [Planctomycetota bacterium]
MSAELFARLARLRREERGAAVAPAALPEWFTTRLEHERDELAVAPGCTLGPPGELFEHTNARGSFCARTRTYAVEHQHGDQRLAETLSADPREFAWLTRDAALATLALERCVFLDIETTGLSGGAGTIPFLVALGSFENGAFKLWQAFLRDPGEEAAAMTEVAERIRAAQGLVSFFGKSFDRHRLEDKMRLHKIAPPFATQPHLDLYHPLVRLYRGAFDDGRLATFESELCGVEREDDLPGSLAPAAWFDFLAERPHRLEAVFRHNELDVLSLVTLAAHLACARHERAPDGRTLPGHGRARARALAELHAARGEHAAAIEWLERALTRAASEGVLGGEGELCFRRAECLRKLGEFARALAEFERLARERTDALGACAWAEVLRLAKRLKRSELAAEALTRGPALVERALTGKPRARALARFRP